MFIIVAAAAAETKSTVLRFAENDRRPLWLHTLVTILNTLKIILVVLARWPVYTSNAFIGLLVSRDICIVSLK